MLQLVAFSQEKENFKKEQACSIATYGGCAQSICLFLLCQILPHKNKWKHILSQ